MWIPGRAKRRQRAERERRLKLMREEYQARRKIEQEMSGDPSAARPRRASSVRRLTFRGRKILLPFLLLAVLLGAGMLAQRSAFLAVPALWLLTSAVWWAVLKRRRLDRASERRYAAACIAAGTVWLVLAHAGIGPFWLALGWTLAALPWWRHHWPRPTVATTVETIGEETIPELWTRNVGASDRALPGAVLHSPGLTEHGEDYIIQAVPGKAGQQKTEILGKLPAISQGLITPQERVVLEEHPGFPENPSVFRLQVIRRSPIKATVYFEEPRWDDGRILLGPYADGIDEAVWRLYTVNSMWGGFLLGGIGGGKTGLLNLLALTARAMATAMPTTLLYLDGQDGASSPTLWKHATWHGGPRDANALLCGLERGLAIRQKWNRVHGLSGFTPGASPDGIAPGLPGVLTIVDEQHRIFSAENGLRWAAIAREGRKVGMAVIGADQFSDLETFGGKDVLRSSLLAGNGLALRTLSRMASNLVPGVALDPTTFPELPGYGYKIAAAGSGERTAPFRARFLPDAKDAERIPDLPVPTVEEWFAKTSDAPLDDMTARAFGPVFLDRHALAEKATQAARDEIEGRVPVVIDMAPTAQPEDDSTTRGQILAELGKRSPLRPVELERLTGKSKSGVKQALTALKADGMVERLDDKGEDGYSVGYVLVPAAVPAA